MKTSQLLLPLKQLKPSNDRVFVFDIDSTLYNVSPRNQMIVRHFAETTPLELNLQNLLLKFISKPTEWGIKQGLLNIFKSNEIDHELIKKIKSHWNKHFFSNTFLHLDEVYPGAVNFLNQLNKISPVYYLTGRDTERMGSGTFKQLEKSGFPVDTERNVLILKPDQNILDHEYKLTEILKIKKSFNEVYFFENEPLILNTIYDFTKDIELIYVNSVNSGRAEIYPEIMEIQPNYE